MCDLCGKRTCAASCPSYDEQAVGGGQLRGVCAECGRALFEGSQSFRKCGVLLCSECADTNNKKIPLGNFVHVRF